MLALTVGATHESVIPVFELFCARGSVGAEGVVTGVAVTDDDAAVQPLLLYAATVNVYAVPFVRLLIWNEVADEPTVIGDEPPFGTGETVIR